MMDQEQPLTHSQFKRLLLIGSGLSVLLLLTASLVAWRTVRQINENASNFATGQTQAEELIRKLQKEQDLLNARRLQLARRADLLKKEDILNQLAESHTEMQSTLIAASQQAEEARENIQREGFGLRRMTVELFGVCVLLSLGFAVYTVGASTKVFSRMEEQAVTLGQVQLQLLESQEQVARRFSHELHDELGQGLTALKANLSAMREGVERERVDDCLRIADDAVKNVRELSQLLRPTILDDFGLNAALGWLTDNFAQRTQIRVHYVSDLGARRLPDATETHLFRIAQEALTNVARHSGASEVQIEITTREREISMKIHDNGRGFEPAVKRAASLGLVGMETRARGANGRLRFVSAPGLGVKIEVTCPIA
jgi:signal transduction histidine kinase